MDRNILNNGKLIGQPLGDLIPKEIKDKVKLYITEPGRKTFKNLPFKGLNSKLFYIELGDDPKKVREDIMKDMDTKEINLVLNCLRKKNKKVVTFVRRKISPEIAKLMGVGVTKDTYRAIIVSPVPVAIKKKGNKMAKLYIAIYGYETLIVTSKK